MGALPKRRISTARKGKRRWAIRLKLPTFSPCPECGQLKRPHQVCPNCGAYGHLQTGKKENASQNSEEMKPVK